MPPKKSKLHRHIDKLPYRKLFVIATEGERTEPQYFGVLNNDEHLTIQVKCLRGGHSSSPPQVLKRMTRYLREEALKSSDEAWLVVDKDQWTDQQLDELYRWAQQCSNYGFALSNPKFEYWLLLHFEDGTSIKSSSDCSDRLNRHLPGYDKEINTRKITCDMIHKAIVRARAQMRDDSRCADWPRDLGRTTVCKLVEKILKHAP